MKNKLIKAAKILKKIFIVILCMVTIFLVCTTAWNKIMCMKEDKFLSKVGTNINVNGTNMRMSVTGEGEKTIVLLSGMGTPSPITDFKPLADKLSKNYKVVTLEYPGYGLSDYTNMEMNNKFIVEEIRAALNENGIKPPYILMPHSISGIYCMQYMNMYPKEIEAMIGIDSSVPNQVKYDGISEISDGLYYLVKFMDITGLSRFSNLFGSDFIKGMESSGGYSEEEIRTVTAMINRKSITKALLNENRNFMDNCKSLYDTKYPDNIPILFLLSNDSCKQYEKEGLSVTWDGIHKEVISNPNIQKLEYLDGEHYLHWTQSETIANMTDEFVQKFTH
jgi:pimeloyl-ACP methyl ester carboxylesterase